MSEKHFEDFLINNLRVWLQDRIEVGARYQFKSPDPENTVRFVSKLLENRDGTIELSGQKLSFLSINGYRLLVAGHLELHDVHNGCYTENYISSLRDAVANHTKPFEDCALLIIHNSLLDTLINSALDLSQGDAIWSPKTTKLQLEALISDDMSNKVVSSCLLNYQAKAITEEGSSVFGFKHLHEALLDGNLQFQELNLFNDPQVLSNFNEQQVERRLEANRQLREEIEFAVEHFPNDLEDRLTKFGSKFISKHFGDGAEVSWKELDYNIFREEEDRQKSLILDYEGMDAHECLVTVRNKKETAAGLRDKHLIIETSAAQKEFKFSLKFLGQRIEKHELQLQPKSMSDKIQIGLLNRGERSTLSVSGVSESSPIFFSLRLNRDASNERYTFHCIVVQKGVFHLEDFENSFLVNRQKRALVLQAKQKTITVNPNINTTYKLKDSGQTVDITTSGKVDFTELYEESDELKFILTKDDASLLILIEGESNKETLRLPLMFDTARFPRLFKDDQFNGIYKPSKETVVIDNQESEPLFLRKQLLQVESAFVTGKWIEWNQDLTRCTPAIELGLKDSELYDAYSSLVSYFENNKTLPSLASWGPELVEIGHKYVQAYIDYLQRIPKSKTLSTQDKSVVRLGFATIDGRSFLTPFHPLLMSYYLKLANEIVKDGEARSFRQLPGVTKSRLNARGLIPHLYDSDNRYSYTQIVNENPFWLEIVPHQETNFDFITTLVKHKIEEFTSTFTQLFQQVDDAPLIINSVNNAENSELFKGIISYYQTYLNNGVHIHVNLYDKQVVETEFDVFAELGMYDEIKERYGLDKGAARRSADKTIDLLRTHLTFSKFRHQEVEYQDYAHLTFFKNDQKVEAVDNNIDEHLSGVACGGLLSGESSRSEGDRYFTAFGLKGYNYDTTPHLKLAKLIGTLWRPAHSKNDIYHDYSAISLAVSQEFMSLLERSYDSSVWTTIIDPKVTLDFFEATKGVILIHYSDQYTSSSGYDAITVTKQIDLYKNVLGRAGNELIREFNAFNGEWLLKLITDQPKEKTAKEGVVAAYKVVSTLLAQSDITWIPLSVAEMIRVAGNIGLAMSDSDFSRYNKGISKGAISDDILFAGFKDGSLFLFPVEVKAGGRPDFSKAKEQALELKRFMEEDLLGPDTLEARLYRSLFIRQVLLQVEKYELYQVFEKGHFIGLSDCREAWLEGEYNIKQLPDYPQGMVVAHINSESCFEEKYVIENDVLIAEIPMGLLNKLVRTPYKVLKDKIESSSLLNIPGQFFLQPFDQQEQKVRGDLSSEVLDSNQANKVVYPFAKSESRNFSAAAEEALGEVKNNGVDESIAEPLVIEFGTDVQTGNTVYWEPTNTDKLLNTNTGIIGTMGTGKTQFTKSLITQLIRNQHNNVTGSPIGVLIFDYKADYVKDDFVEATNAKVLELDCLPFNPFALFGDKKKLPVHVAGQFTSSMSKAYNLGVKQQSKLRAVIRDAYESAGIDANDESTWGRPAPTLEDVWAEFQAQEKVDHDSLYAALEILSSYEIFESDTKKTQSLYDLIDGVTVINLSGYDRTIQNLVVALTLDLFYTQMHQQGSSKLDGNFRQISKVVLVDEADNFMSQDFESLIKILKEGREFGVGTILSTQELTHFKTSENDYSTMILSWVIHQVANIKSQEIKAIFNTQSRQDEEYFMGQIRKLEKHYSLYVDGKMKVVKMKDLAFWELIK